MTLILRQKMPDVLVEKDVVPQAGGLGILTALTQPSPEALRADAWRPSVAQCNTFFSKQPHKRQFHSD